MQADAGVLSRATLADLMAPVDAAGQKMATILAGLREGRAFAGKLAVTSHGGAIRTIDGNLSCVKDHQGTPIRLLILGRDVTAAEAELATVRAERAESARNQGDVVDALRVGLSKLSGGDFTASIEQPFAGTYEDLRVDYNATVSKLANTLRNVAENAENIHNEASDISATADGLSRRTESTAATLEETAAALDELTSSVHATATGAAQADQAVSAAKVNAEDSGRVVIETVSAMDQIASSSEQITSIIKVIDDIAFQTNLLALNAGVEAARAGDAGRGFAVVASEVRALAQRSSDAAREINDLIAQSGAQVKTGVDLVGRTGDALHQIVKSVSEISTLVSEIAGSSQTQSAGLAEINAAVTQLDQSTQQNAARLEEATAASEALRNDAVALVDTVSQFKVSGVTRETGGRVRPHRAPKAADSSHSAPKRRTGAQLAAINGPAAPPSTPIEQAAAEWEDF